MNAGNGVPGRPWTRRDISDTELLPGMAGYGCVRTFARLLGEDSAADLLQETLDEEGAADKTLTTLAETVINVEAVAPAAGR